MTRQPQDPLAKRSCVGCGRAFVPYRAGQLFHSVKCRNATKARNRNHGRKNEIQRLRVEVAELRAKLAELEAQQMK